jgi:NADPH2:quinone reductase
MSRAIRFHVTGGPEVLKLEEVAVGAPGPGEARVRHTAIGLNYIDTYHRTGAYKVPLPSGIGLEAAGVVEAVGADVGYLKEGDRVAYCGGPLGAYSESRVMPADRLVPLPAGVAERDAAAMMLKGLTVQYLFRQTKRLAAGDTILFHAAAGGVGLIACQWAKALGVTMIGTVGSDAKAELARAHGCAHTVVYTRENFVDRVREITDGKGVPVVYDSIGKDTFPASLDCLSPRGLWVLFGAASGPVPPFDMGLLAQKGSLFATRPTLFSHATTRESLLAMADEMFGLMAAGKLKADVGQTFALADAAAAHVALESRQTTGATLLLP